MSSGLSNSSRPSSYSLPSGRQIQIYAKGWHQIWDAYLGRSDRFASSGHLLQRKHFRLLGLWCGTKRNVDWWTLLPFSGLQRATSGHLQYRYPLLWTLLSFRRLLNYAVFVVFLSCFRFVGAICLVLEAFLMICLTGWCFAADIDVRYMFTNVFALLRFCVLLCFDSLLCFAFCITSISFEFS